MDIYEKEHYKVLKISLVVPDTYLAKQIFEDIFGLKVLLDGDDLVTFFLNNDTQLSCWNAKAVRGKRWSSVAILTSTKKLLEIEDKLDRSKLISDATQKDGKQTLLKFVDKVEFPSGKTRTCMLHIEMVSVGSSIIVSDY